MIRENYNYVRNLITEEDRHHLAKLRDAIIYALDIHGLGYGESVYRKLIKIELTFQRIKFQSLFPIEVSYAGEIISVFRMKPLLIENCIICDIKALNEKIDFYDIAKIQSYLRALRLGTGVIFNFGKIELEIRGIRP